MSKDAHLFFLKIQFLFRFFLYNFLMKFKNLFLMIVLLGSLLSSTWYMASHKEIIDTDPCEVESSSLIYLAVNETYDIEGGDLETDDESVVSVEEGRIVALSAGKAQVRQDCHTYIVYVSDLYTAAYLNMEKDYLPENRYTDEENKYLDRVLEYLIEEAGYRSRAAAVEAARFLTLRFPYKLNYFYENGRLEEDHYDVDGEGRYYHKGLYLSPYKQRAISQDEEAQYWGSEIYEWETDTYSPNGLDCSGFITWALYNAGYDCGDIGAGPAPNVFDLSDLGEKRRITAESLDEIRNGDLLSANGHIAMLIGMKDGEYYVAESNYGIDVRVISYTKEELIRTSFTHWVDMDEFYGHNDGKMNLFWE